LLCFIQENAVRVYVMFSWENSPSKQSYGTKCDT